MQIRIFGAATMLLLLAATAASAVTRDEAASAVTSRYRITTPAFLGGFKEIGSVLTPHREGLRVNRPSKAFEPNVVRNRELARAGGGDLPLGVRDSALKPGERLYLYGISTSDDYVQLDLYTVATYVVPGVRGATPLQASVRFQYDGGLAGVTTQKLLDDIGEWLAAEGEAPSAAESRPAPEPRPAGAATGTIRLGQTPEEVTAILGPPEKQILLGAKTIFIYRGLKVVFVDGKVVDAE